MDKFTAEDLAKIRTRFEEYDVRARNGSITHAQALAGIAMFVVDLVLDKAEKEAQT